MVLPGFTFQLSWIFPECTMSQQLLEHWLMAVDKRRLWCLSRLSSVVTIMDDEDPFIVGTLAWLMANAHAVLWIEVVMGQVLQDGQILILASTLGHTQLIIIAFNKNTLEVSHKTTGCPRSWRRPDTFASMTSASKDDTADSWLHLMRIARDGSKIKTEKVDLDQWIA